MFLSEREPYGFHEHADTRRHVVREGETLFEIAGRYFGSMPRGCGFWWAIADFQQDPIIDPTLALDAVRTLFIPSERVLTDVILGEGRRHRGA